jgi:hypothetical protein
MREQCQKKSTNTFLPITTPQKIAKSERAKKWFGMKFQIWVWIWHRTTKKA